MPGSPLSITDGDGRATVTLQKRMDGHFDATMIINGQPVHAMIDTGASATVLTAADAELAGFDPGALAFNVPVSTANGVAHAARVVADEVSVGGITRKNLPLLVTEPGRLGQSLLGMNFIGTLSGFDVRGDRLVLERLDERLRRFPLRAEINDGEGFTQHLGACARTRGVH